MVVVVVFSPSVVSDSLPPHGLQLREGNGTPLQHSCLENPWTEEPSRLRSMGSLRVGHDSATSLSLFTFMHWRRKWQPTPVFLSGESQGRGVPGGLPSMESYGVGHDWINLAAAGLSLPGFPVHHQCLELPQTDVHWVSDAIQPSHPLSSPFPPALSLSQHHSLSQLVSCLR